MTRHIVDFSLCEYCTEMSLDEVSDTCEYCMSQATNEESVKPVNFKKADKYSDEDVLNQINITKHGVPLGKKDKRTHAQ